MVTQGPPPESTEPVAVEAGTYRMPASEASIADYTVTIPEGWSVQYGDSFSKHPDTDEEFGFYAVLTDSIYIEACEGSDGGPWWSVRSSTISRRRCSSSRGPWRAARSRPRWAACRRPRIDLTVPEGFDFETCTLRDALQLWLSPPDDFTVLFADDIASVYIVDVDGQRQVFVTRYRAATSDEDRQELEGVLTRSTSRHRPPGTTRSRA